jgi:hypothetical protein
MVDAPSGSLLCWERVTPMAVAVETATAALDDRKVKNAIEKAPS